MLKILLMIIISISLFAEEDKWDVTEQKAKSKKIEFTVDEGTWMNLDVSPDGKEIVFDMLGDIYIMPVTGGKAKVLREGLAWECQPKFSPDGKFISFTSDIGGGDNIWYMKKDGSEATQITKENFRLLNNSCWMPDGQYIVARKHFTSERSAGAGEMWMYHITGGSGIKLTTRKNDQQDVNNPCISLDGKYLYYDEDMYPGGYFQYNKDPNSQIYVIKQYSFETGENEIIVSGPGGAMRPQISNDGNKLAFVRRVREKSVLFIHDMKTQEEWPISDALAKDQSEAWAIFGSYTRYAWTNNDKNIVVWGKDGKIWNVDVASQTAKQIPFEVTAKHNVGLADFPRQEVAPKTFNAKVIRHAVTSPDGKTLVFNAVGYLWKKSLPNGKPIRITNSTDFEYEPEFHPNGQEIIYVTWNDESYGSIMKVSLSGGTPTKIGSEEGILREPSYSPDGSKIVFWKESGNSYQGYNHGNTAGIYLMNSDGSNSEMISESGEYPIFNNDGSRIYYQTGGYLFGALQKRYHSVDLTGNDERTHFTSKYTTRFIPSPDGKWIAFNELHNAYIAPIPSSGDPVALSKDTKAVPVARITKDAGINLHWSSDSKKIHWTLGEEYFTNDLKDRFSFVDGGKEEIPPLDSVGIKVGLEIETHVPKDTKVFLNARIITVNEDFNVIENGTVVVEGNKIKYVGETVPKYPENATIIDCQGKTIMPGLVDVHAHQGTFRYGLSPQKHWPYWASLAYGITTTHDPSSNSEMIFGNAEMIKAGYMVGPRIYSTGTILYGADGDFKAVINSLDDARSHLRRTKAFGAFSVKSYNQPRREQRQQVMQAARELEMIVVPEGGSHFYHNMSMVLDGHHGVEHNLPVAPLYDDVLKIWDASNTHNTPTLIVAYGAVTGEYYWYQNTNVWEKDRLLRFTPREIIDSRARHRTMIPDEEYENGHILISKSLKKLTDNNTKINMGSHGQIQGIGAHWEIWMLAQGGMTNQECIRAATMNGADYIGMGDQIGSIEEGKIADLIVLEKNPLDDIINTEFVKYTMINGRLFEAETMKELGPEAMERTMFWWENSKYGSKFKWHAETNSFQAPRCVCGH